MFTMNGTLQGDPAMALFQAGSRITRALNEALGRTEWQGGDNVGAAWVPPVDIFEESNGIRIMLEVPGVRAEDVKISLEGHVLTIRGHKAQVAEERTERVHRYERVYGAFERTFTLPASVDAGAIKATYDLGVLCVTLPKLEQARARQIPVEAAPAQPQLRA